MTLTDTHCHLYSEELKNDLAAVLQRSSANQVKNILLPAIDSSSHTAQFELDNLDLNDVKLYHMMGVHPCSIKDDYQKELEIAHQYLSSKNKKYVAIGEIGLDYFWDVSHKKEQLIAFEEQINWAIAFNLPLAIHSRKSTYECIEILKKYKGKLRGVFHCFSGSIEEANEIIKLDFLLGIGGVVTFKNAGVKEVVSQLDLSHIILETDAPYLSPVPYRGKRNEPSNIKNIAAFIAELKNTSTEKIATTTTANAASLFAIPL